MTQEVILKTLYVFLTTLTCFSGIVTAVEPLRAGPAEFHPHLGLGVRYDDNVFVNPDSQRKTGAFSFTAAPGISVDVGDREINYLTFDYTASFIRFVDLSEEDTVDHQVAFAGHYATPKTILDVSHSSMQSTDGNAETGRRDETISHRTDLKGEYEIATKLSLGAAYHQEVISHPSRRLIDYYLYEPSLILYYRILSKTELFIEGAAGWVEPDKGSSVNYQEASLGLRTEPTERISATLKGGYQHRDFYGNEDSIESWLASVTLAIEFTDRTSAELLVAHEINPSITSANNTYETSRVDLTIRQRLLREKMVLSAGAAFYRNDYQEKVATQVLPPPAPPDIESRTDNYWEVRTGADYAFTEWLSFTASYTFRNNVSTVGSVSFEQSVVTFASVFRY